MKALNDEESIIGVPSVGGVAGPTEGGGGKEKAKQVGEAVRSVGVAVAPFKPAGSSITLWGSGRRDGSDINNSMGLAEAYKMILE